MMKTKQKTLLFVALSLLLCAALALGLTATQVSARAADDASQKKIDIVGATAVEYDGSVVKFTVGFDASVAMFDNNYNYVAAGGLPTWDYDFFAQPFNPTVTKEGDENTANSSRYVIKHLNDYIGNYVFLNGVSVRDLVLSYVAGQIDNPKLGSEVSFANQYNAVYTEAWKAIDMRVNAEGNNLIFYGLSTEVPFISSLLGCDAEEGKLTKPLVLTIKKGYTAMDGTVLDRSIQKTFNPTSKTWGDTTEAMADSPANTVTVGAISAPGYDAQAKGDLYADRVYFTAYFSDRAWYDAQITPQFSTVLNWYWALTAPSDQLERFRGYWNNNTPEAPAKAVMQTVNTSVRDYITIKNADGTVDTTVGAFTDSLSGEGFAKFDVLAYHYNDIIVFALSADEKIDAFLGWQDGKIGKDFTITFKAGFATLTGKTIAEDISFVYRAATGVFERDGITIPPEAPEKPITTPVTVRMQTFHDNGQSIGYNICFSENVRPREMGAVDVAGAEWVQDGFMLNGKTFGEIYEYAQENDYDFRVEFEARNQLTVWVDKRIPEEQGGLKKDEGGKVLQSGNTVVIKADIALPREAKLAYDDDIAFENSGANWTKAYIFPDREFAPVEVAGISNPSEYEDGKVKYTVTFSDDVASRQYFQIQANLSWLIGVNTGGGLNNLSEEELKRLEYYGIHSSIADKIVISVNGVAKTVRAWQESDPNPSNYNQGVLQIHYGQDGESNALEILWSGRRIGEGETQFTEPQPLCPSLDAEISITFKKGFRTPNCLEIQEDVTFTYSGEAGAHFVKESAGVVYDTVTFQKVFYNGERIEENGTLTLPAGTFALDKNLFTVLFAEGKGVTLAVTGADSLQEGENTVTLTGTSGNASTSFSFTVVCSQKTSGKSGKSGCGSTAASGALIAAALLLCVSLSMGIVHKRRKA